MTVASAISPNAVRLIARAGTAPNRVTSEIGFSAGVFSHHGMCAAPTTDPAMNASSVTSIRVLPPPAVYNVPDAQPPPNCMPTPNRNAPAITDTPTGPGLRARRSNATEKGRSNVLVGYVIEPLHSRRPHVHRRWSF